MALTIPIDNYLFHNAELVDHVALSKDSYGQEVLSESTVRVDCYIDYPSMKEIAKDMSETVKWDALLFVKGTQEIKIGMVVRDILTKSSGALVDATSYTVESWSDLHDDQGIHHKEVYLTKR